MVGNETGGKVIVARRRSLNTVTRLSSEIATGVVGHSVAVYGEGQSLAEANEFMPPDVGLLICLESLGISKKTYVNLEK